MLNQTLSHPGNPSLRSDACGKADRSGSLPRSDLRADGAFPIVAATRGCICVTTAAGRSPTVSIPCRNVGGLAQLTYGSARSAERA